MKTGRLMLCAGLFAGAGALLLSASAQTLAQDDSPRATRMNTASGPTGLITVPTAFVTPDGQAQVGAYFGRGVNTGTVNYGLIPGLEVGGAYVNSDGDSDEVIATAKINIIPSNWKRVQIGVGMIDPFDALQETYYAVVSTDLLNPPREIQDDASFVRVHAGYGSGMFENHLIGGAEVFLNRKWSVLGEWNGEDFGAALRYAHVSAFRAQAGLSNDRFFAAMTCGLEF